MLRRPSRERCSLESSVHDLKSFCSSSRTTKSHRRPFSAHSSPLSKKTKKIERIHLQHFHLERSNSHISLAWRRSVQPLRSLFWNVPLPRGKRFCLATLKPDGLSAYQRAIGKSAGPAEWEGEVDRSRLLRHRCFQQKWGSRRACLSRSLYSRLPFTRCPRGLLRRWWRGNFCWDGARWLTRVVFCDSARKKVNRSILVHEFPRILLVSWIVRKFLSWSAGDSIVMEIV